jgi:iron(III) transport system ATP-binding protein
MTHSASDMSLVLEEVSVRYARAAREHPAVRRVSLRLQAGQIGVLIGPSGCGKTSLLRAVAGLERLDEGRIVLGGQPLSDARTGTHVAPEARRIGMVFQDYALFPHLSVADNIAFGLAGLPRGERSARVQQMLELVGLAHAARRAPHQLSGGQQQRVAIARALVNEPGAILADEPTGALDSRTGLEIMALFQALHARGITLVVVTHDPEIAAFATRVLTFRDGRLVEDRRQVPRNAAAALAARPEAAA